MFCNAESCVMNNRNSAGYFSLERRERQGDPLSQYLFTLVLISEKNELKDLDLRLLKSS